MNQEIIPTIIVQRLITRCRYPHTSGIIAAEACDVITCHYKVSLHLAYPFEKNPQCQAVKSLTRTGWSPVM